VLALQYEPKQLFFFIVYSTDCFFCHFIVEIRETNPLKDQLRVSVWALWAGGLAQQRHSSPASLATIQSSDGW